MKFIFVLIVFALYIYLFKKAAGTLKINIMNVITFIFFSILGFELIGGSLVYLGFDNHYLIRKITLDTTVDKTYYILAYTCLMLPTVIILCNKYLFKIDKTKNNEVTNLKQRYIDKLKEKVIIEDTKNRNKVFFCIAVLSIICALSIIYVFYHIGSIPILKYFNSNTDFAVERIRASKQFQGNIYIRNLVMLSLTPLISYIAYIYMRTTKEKKWRIIFGFLLILNILALTYNFEKSPILYYIINFFIIEVTLGNTFKLKSIVPVLFTCVIIIFILYKCVMGYDGAMFSISSGPIARIIMAQAGTLFLHIDAFPQNVDYLYGRSFPKIFTGFLGEGEYSIRSGRVVMETYNPTAIENGTAGVLNTLFVGEAYANFGIIGVVIAPIIAGIVFSTILAIFLKTKKSPLNIILYLECLVIFTTVLQGGFIDFFYNIQLLVVLIVIYGIKIFSNKEIRA